jgi:hypothetical protein
MKSRIAFIAASLAAALGAQAQQAPTGYTDTPTIPGSKWRVHDDARPRPRHYSGQLQYADNTRFTTLRCRGAF